ncbi:hypothetical protein [Saccharothrix xinjiangensis]|uniref:Uncharacterized protein n=1 Tax=Saccharothrix xinjiangensis TaxID=204798 RepID=A0ABV9XWP8_9PSEU
MSHDPGLRTPDRPDTATVDVPALIRHGGHHVTVDWRDRTEARRDADGNEISPATPAGYHVQVYPERAAQADGEDAPVSIMLTPVAEGYSPDWAQVWQQVSPLDADAPPQALPDWDPFLRASEAIRQAITTASEHALREQGLLTDVDPAAPAGQVEWTPELRTAYQLAACAARVAVYALVDRAEAGRVTLTDLVDVAHEHRTPEPPEH